MVENKEISALLHLIDDPDTEVFTTVSDRIVSFGKAIIPNLEDLWENTISEDVQGRIESLIHNVHYRDLTEDFKDWQQNNGTLLQGALLTAKYHYPQIQSLVALQEIEKMRRNVWLELNNYLTPLEKVNVMTSILYNYYKLKGLELSYTDPDEFLLHKTLETKKGNAISNGILYLVLCELLDIPVKAIHIPRQFILAYFDPQYVRTTTTNEAIEKIIFYIDPLNGMVYSHKDVEVYFKRINVPITPAHFKQRNNKSILQFLLKELSKCYDNDFNQYKMDELLTLVKLLDQ